jgi:hypothetical protein|tara:strand:+ start:602 stop:784 length:183 start_codon:yes stop_codon:yes gene_type:complete
MLLYLESQLHAAYKVYCDKIPEGNEVMDIDAFRDTIELDEEWFEGLLEEYEDNSTKFTVH